MPAPPLPCPTLSPIRLEPTEGGTDEFPVPSAAAPPRLQLRDLCRKREHQLDQLLAAQLRQCVAPHRSSNLSKSTHSCYPADHAQVSRYPDVLYLTAAFEPI
jgi:hypothetical protein